MNPAVKTPHTTGTMGLLSQLNRVVYRRATEDVLGMKLKQLITLELLANKEGCLQQELGATLMIDPNNCVLLLNDLDQRGYVERQRDPRDRRRHIVVITAAGLEALDKAEAKLEALEGEVLANLAQSEREQLRDLLAHAMEGQDASVDIACLEE
ncbi:MAG TPA: MarR family winged helix-turn-helix transcriptional regulator [Solirubrobacterales bacterium]|nr:MarR family winged helix-turn-helix transcriptional regulator [Solirubrobacterales bacterium]